MKWNRIYFGMLILVLLAIIIWTSYSMLNVGRKEEFHSVAVIVNNSNNERWMVLRQGLEQAAKDYNIDLNYVYTGEFASMEEELAVAAREIEGGAEGIIIQMAFSENDEKEIPNFGPDTAVVLLESNFSTEGIYACVGPDNRALGRALAEALAGEQEDAVEQKRIGILSGNQEQYAMQLRLKGLEEGLEEIPGEIDILWIIDNKTLENGLNQIEEVPLPDIVIALGNDETEQIADYMQAKEVGESCFLYGVGGSEKTVYYLDKGVIRTLVVPNEFNMGYQSMEMIAKQLEYHLQEASDSKVDYLVIDREHLYDVENQKVLFPIVQ